MCQADDVQGGEGSSPSALQMSDTADAEQGPHGKVLRGFAARYPGNPVSAKLKEAAGWVDILNAELRHAHRSIVELRNALREICDSAALTSVADCQIIAEEALAMNARRFKVQHIQRSDEEARSADTATAEERDGSLTQKGTEA